MDNSNSIMSPFRKRMWDWMIKANGEERWLKMRAEALQVIKFEASKIKKEKGYVKYTDLPDWLRLKAIDLMYYPEDVKRIIKEK